MKNKKMFPQLADLLDVIPHLIVLFKPFLPMAIKFTFHATFERFKNLHKGTSIILFEAL